jgi:ABC-2 type transport system ATP-binding protein
MNEKIIETRNLRKEFKSSLNPNSISEFFFPKHKTTIAVNSVDLDVFKGETLGLLGPNGAGKTTLIKLLTGILYPTSGEILIKGKPVEQQKSLIGIMLGYEMIYYRLSGYDNLKYFARLYKIKDFDSRIKELSSFLGFEEYLYDYVENYSLGAKSKLALARALIHDPEILVLDEPTLGLDINISEKIRKYIKKMDKTIILTTHYEKEARELCDRIALMAEGKIIEIENKGNFDKTIKTFIGLGGKNGNFK